MHHQRRSGGAAVCKCHGGAVGSGQWRCAGSPMAVPMEPYGCAHGAPHPGMLLPGSLCADPSAPTQHSVLLPNHNQQSRWLPMGAHITSLKATSRCPDPAQALQPFSVTIGFLLQPGDEQGSRPPVAASWQKCWLSCMEQPMGATHGGAQRASKTSAIKAIHLLCSVFFPYRIHFPPLPILTNPVDKECELLSPLCHRGGN